MSNVKPSKLPSGELHGKKTPLNVILITLDAFSYELFIENLDSLPNLKTLRSQSAFFENAYSIGPSTHFAFPGIISSAYPYHFGMGIDKDLKTIDEILKDYGYNTALINEINIFITRYFGFGMHMDYQKHILNLSEAETHRNIEDALCRGGDEQKAKRLLAKPHLLKKFYKKVENTRWLRDIGLYYLSAYRFFRFRQQMEAVGLHSREKLYRQFQNEFLEFINERFEIPQFLWIHTVINHLPYLPPENSSEFDASTVNYLNCRGLSVFVNHKICWKLKSLYVESMKKTDQFIGEVVNALRTNNLFDQSLIVITADHGEEFMEEGHFGHSPESSSDRLLHVPMIFYCPSILQPKSISVPVSTIDILPTICDLLGISIPSIARGLSLKQILLNTNEDLEECQELHRRPLFSESWHRKGLLDRSPGYTSYPKIFTIRQGAYKLTVTQEQRPDSSLVEKLELIDWINNEKLDINSNTQVVEDLKYLLYKHIHEEGIFTSSLKRDTERQAIRDALGRLRGKAKL